MMYTYLAECPGCGVFGQTTTTHPHLHVEYLRTTACGRCGVLRWTYAFMPMQR